MKKECEFWMYACWPQCCTQKPTGKNCSQQNFPKYAQKTAAIWIISSFLIELPINDSQHFLN